MKIASIQPSFSNESDDPRVFADLMASVSPASGGTQQQPPAAGLAGDAGAAGAAFTPGDFSANAFAVHADQQPGNPFVLGSLPRRPDSYYTNEPLKQAQFYGYGVQYEAPTTQWINTRLGARDADPNLPIAAAGSNDLATDALSSYSAPLKLTARSDAGAYHYSQAPRVSLDHGLVQYVQIVNLAGGRSGAPSGTLS